ncbi:hypothetical protein A4D02_18035 [Niastella koreensis]|uniref:Uncharacterized protein n=2 Tax=Niastella koreensis TaxID=354356 RepID=G8TAE0_NIAKG|nr:hypothetical protein [Niastella koreensis]AEV97087.1 hypothetical protein Niako_0704 [Niastella koreensis GR20-10]OQP39224.1 hypothetical protein A4D02_18035 [Niastella koreensis]
MTAPITRVRLQELPCFSTIPKATKAFFKQWHIYTIDITRILSLPYAEARQEMSSLRSLYGKSKKEAITVDEFCAHTGISKKIVRMHLIERLLEGELKKQVGKANRQRAEGSR